VLVIVPDAHQQEISEEIRNQGLEIRIDYFPVPMDQQLGTAESLILAKDKLITDLIVLSCDIVTDFPLIKLITMYRDQNPSLIALISTRNPTATTRSFGSSKNRTEKDLIGVDGQRLVFFNSESDFGQSIPFPCSMVRKCCDVQIFSNYFDSHVYVFRKDVIDSLIREAVITSIKGEFLPHLIEKQFREQNTTSSDSNEEDGDEIEQAFAKLEPSSGSRTGLMLRAIDDTKYPNSRTRCFVKLVTEGYCVRSNSLTGYMEANKVIASGDSDKWKGKNFVNSVLGKNSTCAENSHFIRSVIGSNCNIKANVKVTDSILMDGVTIEEGCLIQGSVICTDARIGKKSSLERCLVSVGYQVHPQSQFANEFLADGGEVDMFEF
jgi:translation initiation factor eIF-2B subunit gamma